MIGCSSEPETKEEVMEAFLKALAECDLETVNELSVDKYDYDCSTYETEVIKVECEFDGKWSTCCCEEEIAGRTEFNGRIYSKYTMEQIDGKWKVGGMHKESDFGRRYHTNICE